MSIKCHVNVDKQQTACCISLIAAIGAILITITYPKPWDALQISNGAISLSQMTFQPPEFGLTLTLCDPKKVKNRIGCDLAFARPEHIA